MQKNKTTKRKFYGKWLYKVSVRAPGIAILRSKTIDDAIDFLKLPVPDTAYRHSLVVRAHGNATSLLTILGFLKTLSNTAWTKRIETHQLDFYTNEKSVYDNFCSQFDRIVLQKFEPEQDNIELLKNQYTIVVKKLPHNKYKYKAFLRPHKMKGDVDAKQRYLDWIALQEDRVRISDIVKEWFMYTDWNWDRRYILIQDKETLLMLQMRSGEAIGKVYEYAVVDK